MSLSRHRSSLNSGPLGDVIADYLQAVERGERPDRQTLLKAHPLLAEELAAYFEDLDRMNKLAAPLHLNDETVGPEENLGNSLPRVRYFGDFELEAEIARGGMGVVYRARQKTLNRVVALKMILSGQLASAADVARFRSEAEAAANLDHPNILPIYEVGEHEGQQYFSMKLIEGGSLASRIAELIARPRDGAVLVARLARAIHFAHQRGILHRDIKPANVLLDPDGTPYITDFGLAKRTEEDSGLTRTGAIIGTPSYMSPEQARADKQVTTLTDVYSLGVILYELLTGRPPFRAATVHETIQEVMEKEPDHPRKYNPRADRDLSAVALKCLQKSPENRYESAAGLADDLNRWLNGEPTKARPASLVSQAWRWLKRNAAATAGVVGLGVAAGLIAVLTLFIVQDEKFLYPNSIGFLNLLTWIRLAQQVPAFRIGVLITAGVLGLGFGWLLLLITRPRTERVALAAAAASGLIATLTSFAIFGPVIGAESCQLQYLRLHPISDEFQNAPRGARDMELSPSEVAYLSRYLPDYLRAANAPGRDQGLQDLRVRAANTNQFFASVTVGSIYLVFMLLFFIGLSVESTWAADYLNRSGRGPLAQAVCYMEVYTPAAFLLIYCLTALQIGFIMLTQYTRGGPTLGQMLSLVLLGAALVGLIHYGVIRRWHPAIRSAIFLGAIGIWIGWAYWAFGG